MKVQKSPRIPTARRAELQQRISAAEARLHTIEAELHFERGRVAALRAVLSAKPARVRAKRNEVRERGENLGAFLRESGGEMTQASLLARMPARLSGFNRNRLITVLRNDRRIAKRENGAIYLVEGA